MNTPQQEDKRAALARSRAQLALLSDAELARRLYLVGLVQRIDTELIAMKTLFGSGDEAMGFEPPVDTRITALAHLMQTEFKRRSVARTKILHTGEGEENTHDHTNHAHQQNGNH